MKHASKAAKVKSLNNKKRSTVLVAGIMLGVATIVGLQVSDAYAARSKNTANTATTTQGGKIMKAADPSIIYSNGMYYGTYVSGGNLYVRKAAAVAGIASATPVKVWTNTGVSEVWAPEIIKYNGTYYIYFTYGAGAAHRMYVISSSTPDGGYGAATKVNLPDDRWAIDGYLFTYNGETWFTWSGWQGTTNGEQVLYVARMSDPANASGARYMISRPTEAWERKAGGSWGLPYVNEAPQPVIDPNNQLHIGYSANGYWAQTYCAADLRLRADGDITNMADWFKSNGCLLSSSSVMTTVGTLVKNAKGTGHHSFILPDGDINQSPAAGTTTQFAYAGVPSTSLFLPDSYRAWYWGNKTWVSNVTYTRTVPTAASDTGWTTRFYE